MIGPIVFRSVRQNAALQSLAFWCSILVDSSNCLLEHWELRVCQNYLPGSSRPRGVECGSIKPIPNPKLRRVSLTDCPFGWPFLNVVLSLCTNTKAVLGSGSLYRSLIRHLFKQQKSWIQRRRGRMKKSEERFKNGEQTYERESIVVLLLLG